MSEKQTLLNSLFDRPGRELLNIKFFRGSSENITEERFSAEVNKVVREIDEKPEGSDAPFIELINDKTDVKELAEGLS